MTLVGGYAAGSVMPETKDVPAAHTAGGLRVRATGSVQIHPTALTI
jgi:hypothetical protein